MSPETGAVHAHTHAVTLGHSKADSTVFVVSWLCQAFDLSLDKCTILLRSQDYIMCAAAKVSRGQTTCCPPGCRPSCFWGAFDSYVAVSNNKSNSMSNQQMHFAWPFWISFKFGVIFVDIFYGMCVKFRVAIFYRFWNKDGMSSTQYWYIVVKAVANYTTLLQTQHQRFKSLPTLHPLSPWTFLSIKNNKLNNPVKKRKIVSIFLI